MTQKWISLVKGFFTAQKIELISHKSHWKEKNMMMLCFPQRATYTADSSVTDPSSTAKAYIESLVTKMDIKRRKKKRHFYSNLFA